MGLPIALGIAAAVALAVVFVFIYIRGAGKKAADENRKYQGFLKRQEIASHGSALVVRADSAVPGDGATQVRVLLTLEVTPPGKKPYRAHTDWLVGLTALGYLHAGAEIGVRIDAQDPHIIYPAEEWARFVME